ncbi:hypothetical protein FE784_11505 [Paenibacillus hemerocallicola]|uniref:Uncharacterized protein n=1 Tax=Paenibacillus hemerocallicola TaxID=1172614 RepID=A0A5C4TB48_9BACL|nr:hypothetical protein [Paenibacillus hemerocallicola]TNJ66293.1 hypothetical protein FE784_11505 [Paenibacillus hemerocallicola]
MGIKVDAKRENDADSAETNLIVARMDGIRPKGFYYPRVPVAAAFPRPDRFVRAISDKDTFT